MKYPDVKNVTVKRLKLCCINNKILQSDNDYLVLDFGLVDSCTDMVHKVLGICNYFQIHDHSCTDKGIHRVLGICSIYPIKVN